jgi:hypothetical protein
VAFCLKNKTPIHRARCSPVTPAADKSEHHDQSLQRSRQTSWHSVADPPRGPSRVVHIKSAKRNAPPGTASLPTGFRPSSSVKGTKSWAEKKPPKLGG